MPFPPKPIADAMTTSNLGPGVGAFLLAFPALFSIVNPPGAAFIFNEVTADLRPAERRSMAGHVAAYSLGVLLVSLWGGAYVLEFFGISLGALRIAGGTVVALRAWDLLSAPENQEARKQEQAGSSGRPVEDIAFFPLTLPFTTGPGTIAVAVALGAGRPTNRLQLLEFFAGASTAAIAIALCVWIMYRSADRMNSFLGASARRTIARLTAFLLMCIGVQIVINGAVDIVRGVLQPP
jgi:multiple antibiotic resistance protein